MAFRGSAAIVKERDGEGHQGDIWVDCSHEGHQELAVEHSELLVCVTEID